MDALAGIGLRTNTRAAAAGRRGGRGLPRDPRRELLPGRRAAAAPARTPARAAAAVAPRRRAVDRRRGAAGRGASRCAGRAAAALRAALVLRSTSPGPATAAPGSTTCCRCPTTTRPCNACASTSTACRRACAGACCWRTRAATSPTSARPGTKVRSSPSGAPHRLRQLAARRQQRLRGGVNHGRDPWALIEALPVDAIGEIHLAGFAEDRDAAGDRLLIDHHGAPVDAAVRRSLPAHARTAGPAWRR